MSTHRIDEGRLTDLDYARIDDTVSAYCADQVAARSYGLRYDLLAVTRLAHHSIGCSAYDLRDVEIAQINSQVGAIVDYYDDPARGRFYRVGLVECEL